MAGACGFAAASPLIAAAGTFRCSAETEDFRPRLSVCAGVLNRATRRMKHVSTARRREFFKVLASTREAQAAMMTMQPGQDTGEPQSEHPDSEQ